MKSEFYHCAARSLIEEPTLVLGENDSNGKNTLAYRGSAFALTLEKSFVRECQSFNQAEPSCHLEFTPSSIFDKQTKIFSKGFPDNAEIYKSGAHCGVQPKILDYGAI
jgi:hypothetical protein